MIIHSAPRAYFGAYFLLCRANSGPVPPKGSGISDLLLSLHLIRHRLRCRNVKPIDAARVNSAAVSVLISAAVSIRERRPFDLRAAHEVDNEGRISADHRTIGNRVGPASARRGAGGNLANWKPGTLGSARRGARRVDAGPPLPGVPAWGALGRRPWPPPWPGGARPGCREGRDFGGCSPECSRTHVPQGIAVRL